MALRPESQSSPPKADDSVKFEKNFLTASLRGPASKQVNDRSHRFFGDLYLEEPKYHLTQTKLDEYKELRKEIEALEKRVNEQSQKSVSLVDACSPIVLADFFYSTIRIL